MQSSAFLWDYLNYLVPVTGCIFLFLGFKCGPTVFDLHFACLLTTRTGDRTTEFAGEQTGYVILQFLLCTLRC